jgi:hypothetical protein
VAKFSTIHWDYYNYCPATFCGDRRSRDADHLSKSIGSDCIDMNAFSINPNLVEVDRNQARLIQLLEKQGLDTSLAALQNVGRRAPLHCVGHPPNRNANDYFD